MPAFLPQPAAVTALQQAASQSGGQESQETTCASGWEGWTSWQQPLVITVLDGQYLLNLSRCSGPEKEWHTATQPLHEGSPMFLKAETKDFLLFPLASAVPPLDTYLAEHRSRAGNCPGCTSPFLQFCSMHPSFWK